MKKGKLSFLAVVLILLAFTTLIVWGTTTSWGKVNVKRLYIAGDDGATYSALAFIPKTATNATPAPAVIDNHGNTSNSISILQYGIEQSRRGYVALVVDIAGRGSSELPSDGNTKNSTKFWIEYCLSAPYIDSDHLNMLGFSMSGSYFDLAIPYAEHFDTFLGYSSSPTQFTKSLKVNCIGFRGEDDDLMKFNTGSSTQATAGSGAGAAAGSAGGASGSAGAAGGAGSGKGSAGGGAKKAETYPYSIKGGEEGISNDIITFAKNNGIMEFEVNTVYGSFEDKTAREFVIVKNGIHIGSSFYRQALSAGLEFLQNSSPAPNPIDSNNFAFKLHDWMGLVSMCLIVGLILALVDFFTKKQSFSSIVREMPENIGLRKVDWAISAVVAAVVPLLIYVKATGLQGKWFPIGRKLFKLALPNGILIFLLALVILSIVMGVVFWLLKTKKEKKAVTLAAFGMTDQGNRLNLSIVGKSFGLAVLVVTIVIAFINTVNLFLGTEYSFWIIDFSSVSAQRIKDAIPYMFPYIVAMTTSSFGMNVERRLPETGNKRKDMIIACVVNAALNVFGILLVVVINVISAHVSPTNKQAIGGGLYALFAWGMVFAMTYIAVINTYCYRKTGTIWLGVFINALFVPLMLCNGVPYSNVREGAATSGAGTYIWIAVFVFFVAAAVFFALPQRKKEN